MSCLLFDCHLLFQAVNGRMVISSKLEDEEADNGIRLCR